MSFVNSRLRHDTSYGCRERRLLLICLHAQSTYTIRRRHCHHADFRRRFDIRYAAFDAALRHIAYAAHAMLLAML